MVNIVNKKMKGRSVFANWYQKIRIYRANYNFSPLKRRFDRELKVKLAWGFCLLLFFVVFIDYFGVLRVYMEKDFATSFQYPMYIEDFPETVKKFRNGESSKYTPINEQYSSINFLQEADGGCPGPFDLIILVKSAPSYFEKRAAIRATWGNSQYLKNISSSLLYSSSSMNSFLSTKLVFLLGNEKFPSDEIQDSLLKEISEYKDIVMADFTDSYENNTIKAMIALRWTSEICTNFQFAFLVDDDMYISIKNLFKFIKNPDSYPNNNDNTATKTESRSSRVKSKNEADLRLYGGKVLNVRPYRNKLGSKWYLPLEEYPYNYFPPYVPAAAVVMSKSTVLDFYYASFFTQPFRFDDVFLGILAYKMNIIPVSSNYFHVCHTVDGRCHTDKDESPDPLELRNSLQNVIAKHGLSSTQELIDLWRQQKDIGNV